MQQMCELEEEQQMRPLCEGMSHVGVDEKHADVPRNVPPPAAVSRPPTTMIPIDPNCPGLPLLPQVKRIATLSSIPGFRPITEVKAGPALVSDDLCDAALSYTQALYPTQALLDDDARQERQKRRKVVDKDIAVEVARHTEARKAEDKKHEGKILALTTEKVHLESLEDADRNIDALLRAKQLNEKFGDQARWVAEQKAAKQAKKHADNAKKAAEIEEAMRQGYEMGAKRRRDDPMAEPDYR